MRVAAGAIAIAAAGAQIAACGGGRHQHPPVSERSPSLACGQYIDTRPPTPDYTVVLGVVALPTAPRSPALQTGSSGESNPAIRLFAKTGLLIRTGTRFELAIPPAWAGRLRLLAEAPCLRAAVDQERGSQPARADRPRHAVPRTAAAPGPDAVVTEPAEVRLRRWRLEDTGRVAVMAEDRWLSPWST